MSAASTLVRRLFWLLAIALAGGAGYRWWRERQIPTRPDAPEWPPIDVPSPRSDASESTTAPEDAGDTATSDEAATPEDTGDTTTSDDTLETASTDEAGDGASARAPTAAAGASSVVNALVDAPEARSVAGGDARWVEPEDDGSCPLSHPIKANDNSGIFHVPDGRFYERTKAERCYADADAALADGYRQAKS